MPAITVPYRLHTRTLDRAGCPDLHPAFIAFLDRGHGDSRRWWDFAPIADALRQQGYGRGLDVITLLRGDPPVSVPSMCKILGISAATAKKRFKEAWDAAYEQFGQRYPDKIWTPFYAELWTSNA
jgi:hypothetical protein